MINRLLSALLVLFFKRHSAKRNRRPGTRPRPDRVRRILLVSTTGLGDTVLSAPAMAAARRAWPEAKIFALVHSRWANLFSACPYLDGVIAYPGKFRKVRPLLIGLGSLDLDLILVLHHNDPDMLPLVYLSGPGYIVCRETTKFSFLLDQGVPIADPERHIAERRLDIVRAMAGPVEAEAARIFVSGDKRAWADEFWRQRGMAPEERLAALNPGGSRQAKRWPEEHWQELVHRLHSVHNLRVALFGSPSERRALEDLTHGLGPPDILVVTRPDISETAALLERAGVLIGPDSGLGHLAVSLSVPALILFGPDNPALSGPYLSRSPAVALQSDKTVCPDIAACRKKTCRPNLCLWEITPDKVLAALERDLNFSLDFQIEID